jgi:hypothetical protein
VPAQGPALFVYSKRSERANYKNYHVFSFWPHVVLKKTYEVFS